MIRKVLIISLVDNENDVLRSIFPSDVLEVSQIFADPDEET